MSELMSVSVQGTTVMFTSFPDSLRGKGYLFSTRNGRRVISNCFPELLISSVYVCDSTEERDHRELNFKTIEQVEDFVNSLEDFCIKNNISFSREGKIVLGGL